MRGENSLNEFKLWALVKYCFDMTLVATFIFLVRCVTNETKIDAFHTFDIWMSRFLTK